MTELVLDSSSFTRDVSINPAVGGDYVRRKWPLLISTKLYCLVMDVKRC